MHDVLFANVPKSNKCDYCNLEFPQAVLKDHMLNCDMRKLLCEKCGDLILMDIYEAHLETCIQGVFNPMTYVSTGYPDHIYLGNPDGSFHDEDWDDAQDDFDDDNYEYDEDEPPMSYEQLIALDNTIQKKGLTQEQLSKFHIEKCGVTKETETCHICLNEYKEGESIRRLPCHYFHKACIDTWLSENITCPVCKKFLR